MLSSLARILAIVLVTLLLVWSLIWTLAAYQDNLAIVDLVSAMHRGNMNGSSKDFSRLDNAVLLNPIDADYRLRKVYFARERCRLTAEQAEATGCCSAADLRAYRKILRLRPVWGDAWLDYADCLRDSGENRHAVKALDRALRLAPVNYGVTRRALPLGFALLDGMNASQRQRFTQVMELVLTRFPRYVIQRAIEADRVAFLSPLLPNDRQRNLLKVLLKRAQKAKR